jgi:hypothetical protein
MLTRGNAVFCGSACTYVDAAEGYEKDVIIGIDVRGRDDAARKIAVIDTAATYTIMNPVDWCLLGLEGAPGERITIGSRYGPIRAIVHRTALAIVAECGDDVEVEDVCVALAPEWPDPIFLGLRNMLDKIRFAVDPIGKKFYFDLAE